MCTFPDKAHTIGPLVVRDFILHLFTDDDVGCDALADVNELKGLVGRLEAKIKENFKRADEIREWRSQLAVASTAVEVYRLLSRSLLILLSMLYRL